MNRSALAVVGCLLGGCFGLVGKGTTAPKPVVTVKQLGTAPGAAGGGATDQVSVYRSNQELPRGFFFAQGGGNVKLHAAEGFPSPDQAHVVIAGMAAAPPAGSNGYLRPADIEAAFVAKAKELGANGLFLVPGKPRVGYAIHVGAGAIVEKPQTHGALLASEGKKSPGYEPAGKPAKHDMAAPEPITLKATRGTCYRLAFALDVDAVLGPEAETGIAIASRSVDALMSNRSTSAIEPIAEVDGFELRAPSNGRYLRLRSGSLELGCAWGASDVTVSVGAYGKAPLGEGHFWTRVYRKRIPNAELKRRKAEYDRAVAQAEREAEQYRREQQARRQRREAERQQRDAERQRQRDAARVGRTQSSGHSGYYSFSLKNECRQTVKLKITSSSGNPKFAGGTSSSIGANTIRSFSGTGPTHFWIVDASGNGMSSFTATSGQRDMQITASCSGFAPR